MWQATYFQVTKQHHILMSKETPTQNSIPYIYVALNQSSWEVGGDKYTGLIMSICVFWYLAEIWRFSLKCVLWEKGQSFFWVGLKFSFTKTDDQNKCQKLPSAGRIAPQQLLKLEAGVTLKTIFMHLRWTRDPPYLITGGRYHRVLLRVA